MTYKATYYVGNTPKETRYYRSVIEAALYFEKHPGEFDGMSAELQRVQDMRQGKDGGNEGHDDGVCCDQFEDLGGLE